MRQKRAKTYRKLMALYSMSFGFRQPYQVLVDSEICKFAAEQKSDLAKQLASVLQGEVKPMITQCCIHELYVQKSQQPAVDLAKTFERRKCNHREPIPGDDCLTSVVGQTNKHRYVIATQSQPLRSTLRAIPAVPIIHIKRSVMILEPASDSTIRAKHAMEQQALRPTGAEEALATSSTASARPLKKKGPKEPNPLSVKKKKPNTVHPTKEKDFADKARGFKRKRAEDGDEPVGSTESGVDSAGDGVTRKRKRRRKSHKHAESASQPSSL